MIIYCSGCEKDVEARLTDGKEIYPHRNDLSDLPFWKCDICKGYVGCHHKTSNRTKPLGIISTKQLREARKHIHAILDPLWKSGKVRRGVLYAKLADILGYEYHTANIRTIEEARKVYAAMKRISCSL